MKKYYVSPDVEIIRLRLNDAILSSPTENSVPISGGDTPLPEGDELPDDL